MENKSKNNKKSIFLYIGLTVLVIVLAILIAFAVNKSPSENQLSQQQNVATKNSDSKSSKDVIKQDGIKNAEKTVEEIEQEKSEAIIEEKKEEKYTEEYKEYLELTDEEKKEVEVIPREEKIEYEVIEEIIEEQEKDLKEEVIEENEMPASFDLRDVIDIKVEDQGSYGLCWDFATMACVETNLSLTKGKEYDFSEAHVDYLTSNLTTEKCERGIHDGGNFEIFIKYTENYDGFVLEEDLPLGDYEEYEYSTFMDMEGVNETVIKTVNFPTYYPDYEWTEEEFNKYQNTIKNHIKNYGAIYMSTMGSSFDTNWYYSDTDYSPTEGHAVVIIGWDDNYSKDNFTSPSGKKPTKDGAYIILNSWGTYFGENGFGYISYEDYFVHSDLSGIVSTNIGDAINLDKLNNKQLAKYIKNTYKDDLIVKNGVSYIKQTTLEGIWTLDLSNQNLDSIEDIEIFANLCSLDLSGNNITDVSGLEKLTNLGSLNLSNLKDVTGYENLTNIWLLNLRNCNFKDISKLSNLTNLEYLDLSENKELTNIDTLTQFAIWTLVLEDCNLKDISEITKITTLNDLNISNNKEIENLEKIQDLENLDMLYLNNCEIEDVSNISQKSLWYLDLSNNKNLSNIDKLTNVAYLILNNCEINDLSILPETSALEGLSLKNNNITDVTPIKDKKYERLFELDLSDNTNLTGSLEGTTIGWLTLNNCNLTKDFNFFELKSMDCLTVKENKLNIQDITSKIQCGSISIDEIHNFDITSDYGTILYNTTIYMDIEIPKENNIKFYIGDICYTYMDDAYECENAQIYEYYNYIKLNGISDSKITIKSASSSSGLFCDCDVIINCKVVEDLSPTELVILKQPNKLSYQKGEKIDLEGIVVKENYNCCIIYNVKDYEIISNEEDFVEGENEIIISKNGTTAEFTIKYREENNDIVLQFGTLDLFLCIEAQIPQDKIVESDESSKTIIVTEETLEEFSSCIYIEDSMIDDLVNVPQLNLKDLVINYNGLKITQEQIEILKQYPELKSLTIVNWTNTDDVIVDQDYFEITMIN